MSTIYRNFLSGTLSSELSSSGTSMSAAGLASLPVVGTPDTMWIVLDPEAVNGAPEIVKVTTHTSTDTAATIARAQQTTDARIHPVGTVWAVAWTQSDADQLPFRILSTRGDILYASGANTVSRLALGTENTVLLAGADDPAWGLVDTANIADDAITSAKLGIEAVDHAAIAEAAVDDYNLDPAVLGRVGAEVTNGAGTAIGNGVSQTIPFSVEVQDEGGFHTGSDTNLRVPGDANGIYAVTVFYDCSTGLSGTTVTLDAGAYSYAPPVSESDHGIINMAAVPLSLNDDIEVTISNASGSSKTYTVRLLAFRVSR